MGAFRVRPVTSRGAFGPRFVARGVDRRPFVNVTESAVRLIVDDRCHGGLHLVGRYLVEEWVGLARYVFQDVREDDVRSICEFSSNGRVFPADRGFVFSVRVVNLGPLRNYRSRFESRVNVFTRYFAGSSPP